MRTISTPSFLLLGLLALSGHATAQSTSIDLEALFDRDPHDFSEPRASKFQIKVTHTSLNGIVIGGSFVPQVKAHGGGVSYNLEATLGYKWKLSDVLSLSGSVGVGEHVQREPSGDDFAYYVLRLQSDIKLSARLSWDAISFRYRDAFDTDNDYNTPELATGFTLKLDDARSVYAKYYYDWKEGIPNSQGIGIGFKHAF